MRHYLLNLLIAIDQGGNAFLGGNPDETISSRVGKAAISGCRLAKAAERLIDGLFRLLAGTRGHCRSCIEWDEA
jgi:hypothetical protein